MQRRIKRWIRERLQARGWDLERYPAGQPSVRRAAVLNDLGVALVVDVGANAGQYGEAIRRAGYDDRILSLEPTAEAFAKLSSVSRADPKWDALHVAAGAVEGFQEIHVSANSVSSSLLPMLDLHTQAAPTSEVVRSERVTVVKLDNVVPRGVVTYVKIDTQGFEDQVLLGAADLLPSVAAIELELSLAPLYEGQTLAMEMIQTLEDQGLKLASVSNGFWDRRTGRTLQFDGVFIRG